MLTSTCLKHQGTWRAARGVTILIDVRICCDLCRPPSSESCNVILWANVNTFDVCDVIYVRFGPYLHNYFWLLHGPTVLLLMYCYLWNKLCLFQQHIWGTKDAYIKAAAPQNQQTFRTVSRKLSSELVIWRRIMQFFVCFFRFFFVFFVLFFLTVWCSI